jgi:intracellular sulfur oxidation DsrE/DsrF family protein
MNKYFLLANIMWAMAAAAPVAANEPAPWGHASSVQQEYHEQKVLYDLTTGSEQELGNILARVGLLSKLNGENPFDSSIVVVIHGDAIPFFTIANTDRYRDLMTRAHGLVLNEVVKFRMCQAAASLHGYRPADFHGFVSMVPMADAEIVRLQQTGYAYMH